MAERRTTKPHSVLFVGGSMNQTTQMRRIADELPEYDRWFTPYDTDGIVGAAARAGLVDSTIIGRLHLHEDRTIPHRQTRS
jgi:hypothetical protein